MNRIFDRCGKCTFYTENPKADKWSFEGFCDNKTYRVRLKVNESSQSCDRGEPLKNQDNSKIPEKKRDRGEYND
jgi:hypothetical protein